VLEITENNLPHLRVFPPHLDVLHNNHTPLHKHRRSFDQRVKTLTVEFPGHSNIEIEILARRVDRGAENQVDKLLLQKLLITGQIVYRSWLLAFQSAIRRVEIE
jgi:hypothetical protein